MKYKPLGALISLGVMLIFAACGPGLVPTIDSPTPGDDQIPDSDNLDIILTPPAEDPPPGDFDIIITPPAGGQPVGEDIIINIFPDEYLTYLGYLDVINAHPGAAAHGQIEGTIISTTHSEVCPYQEEVCPIEPYPNDWGIVRVDRVLSYTPFTEGDSGSSPEQPAESNQGDTDSISGFQGQDVAPKSSPVSPLSEGQEVTAQFVLTTRPAVVRHIPGINTVPADIPDNIEGGAEDTVSQPAKPAEFVYKPLPRERGVYLFTKIGDSNLEMVNELPGLEVGTRFRAEVRYDGIMYITEYVIIP